MVLRKLSACCCTSEASCGVLQLAPLQELVQEQALHLLQLVQVMERQLQHQGQWYCRHHLHTHT